MRGGGWLGSSNLSLVEFPLSGIHDLYVAGTVEVVRQAMALRQGRVPPLFWACRLPSKVNWPYSGEMRGR
jgi:hypothetical protein